MATPTVTQVKQKVAQLNSDTAVFVVTNTGMVVLEKDMSAGILKTIGKIDTQEYINEVIRLHKVEAHKEVETFEVLPRNVIMICRRGKDSGSRKYAIQLDPIVIPYRIKGTSDKIQTYNLALPYSIWIIETTKSAVSENIIHSSVFFTDQSFWDHGIAANQKLYPVNLSNINAASGGICMGSASVKIGSQASLAARIASIPNSFFSGVANRDLMPYHPYKKIYPKSLTHENYDEYLEAWSKLSKENPYFWNSDVFKDTPLLYTLKSAMNI